MCITTQCQRVSSRGNNNSSHVTAFSLVDLPTYRSLAEGRHVLWGSWMWNLEADGVDCIQASQVFRIPGDHGPVNCLPIVPLPKGKGGTPADATRIMGFLLTRCSISAFLLVENFRYADESVHPRKCMCASRMYASSVGPCELRRTRR